jgi:AcrR family transcriptional regulator
MAPRKDESRTVQDALRDLRKQQIIDAARELIGRRGYAAVTMGRIAQGAGISRSTLYAYFQNMETIVQEAFALGQQQLEERIARLDTESGDAGERLVRMIAETFRYFDEHKAFFQAVVTQAYLGAQTEPGGSLVVGALGRDFRRKLADVLRKGVAKGVLRPHDVRESSLVLALTVHGAIGVRVRDPKIRVPADEAAAVVVGYFIRGITSNSV